MNLRRKRPLFDPLEDARRYIINGEDQPGLGLEFINEYIGRGVFTSKDFHKGDFLLQYNGELLSYTEGVRRETSYPAHKGSFLYFFKDKGIAHCVDATESSGLGRFVNDSHKSPNCKMAIVPLGGRPKLCLFALHNILEGSELRYDYGVKNLPWRSKSTCKRKQEPTSSGQMKRKKVVEHDSLTNITFSGFLKTKEPAGTEPETEPESHMTTDLDPTKEPAGTEPETEPESHMTTDLDPTKEPAGTEPETEPESHMTTDLDPTKEPAGTEPETEPESHMTTDLDPTKEPAGTEPETEPESHMTTDLDPTKEPAGTEPETEPESHMTTDLDPTKEPAGTEPETEPESHMTTDLDPTKEPAGAEPETEPESHMTTDFDPTKEPAGTEPETEPESHMTTDLDPTKEPAGTEPETEPESHMTTDLDPTKEPAGAEPETEPESHMTTDFDPTKEPAETEPKSHMTTDLDPVNNQEPDQGKSSNSIPQAQREEPMATMQNQIPPSFPDASRVPLRKLSVDLIKTYKHIKETKEPAGTEPETEPESHMTTDLDPTKEPAGTEPETEPESHMTTDLDPTKEPAGTEPETEPESHMTTDLDPTKEPAGAEPETEPESHMTTDLDPVNNQEPDQGKSSNSIPQAQREEPMATMQNQIPPSFPDASQVPLRKLSVDLIKTYKHIKEKQNPVIRRRVPPIEDFLQSVSYSDDDSGSDWEPSDGWASDTSEVIPVSSATKSTLNVPCTSPSTDAQRGIQPELSALSRSPGPHNSLPTAPSSFVPTTSFEAPSASSDAPTTSSAAPTSSPAPSTSRATKYKKPKRRCPFCEVPQSVLSRHITLKHADKECVKQALALPKREKEMVFASFRKDAMKSYNLQQAKEEDPVYERERYHAAGEMIMCALCNGFYAKNIFHRHKTRCQGDGAGVACAVPMALMTTSRPEVKDQFRDEILSTFHKDSTGIVCTTDPDLIMIGQRLWQKHRRKKDKMVEVKKSVRNSMRRLANLYGSFQKALKKPSTSLCDMFDRDNFSALEEAIDEQTTKEGSGMKPGSKVAIEEQTSKEGSGMKPGPKVATEAQKSKEGSGMKPGLKVGLQFLITKAAKIIKGTYIMNKLDEKGREVDMFLEVLDLHKEIIFGDAAYELNSNKQENLRKPASLPLEEDIERLREHTVTRIKELLTDPFLFWDIHTFVEVRDLVVSRLTLFNARRGGEPARLRIKEFTAADKNSWISKEEKEKLGAIEKATEANLKITYMTGKGNDHLVSVIITSECVEGMRKLVDKDCRKNCNVAENNPYVFASTGQSLSHVSGWHAVDSVSDSAGVISKTNLTATKNRHRVSTRYACLDVPQSERLLFYKHLGHSGKINETIYQTPLALQALTKVGRSLQLIDGAGSSVDALTEAGKSDASYPLEDIPAGSSVDALTQAGKSDASFPLEDIPGIEEPQISKSAVSASHEEKGRKYTRWKRADEKAVQVYFRNFINGTSERKIPGRGEIEKFLSMQDDSFPHDWFVVKTKVINETTKSKKRAAKRIAEMMED